MRAFLFTAAVAVALGCVAFLALSSSCSDKDKATRPRDGNDSIPPLVSVLTPNGGETLFEGFSTVIRWVATDNTGVDSVSLYYSTDGGSTYPNWIATSGTGDSSYVWKVPATPSTACKVMAVAYDRGLNHASDTSDNVFTIAPLDTIPSDTTVVYGFKLINAYPHDKTAFTEGLVYENGYLFESTGFTNISTIRRADLETGDVLQLRKLLGPYFGEGISIWQDRIYQLTWTSRVGFVYDKASFDSLGLFYYPHEGWGMTQDGTRFVVSDGTPRLRFWDLSTLSPIDSVDVYQVVGSSRLPVRRLNELEYINGKIYANVWLSDLIAIICPQTGKIEAWIKLTDLVARERALAGSDPFDVLNGIAYDEVNDRLFVTGKYWPEVLEIQVVQN